MTGAVSPQTRRNRSVGGRKAALATKAARARRDQKYGPEGRHRGSAPAIDGFDTILSRLRDRAAALAKGG